MRAILLAGGKGTRLQPFTATFPKPLVPLDDVPVIEVLAEQLREHGGSD
jgi:NDP-sugar pyrophosphorylase family protein